MIRKTVERPAGRSMLIRYPLMELSACPICGYGFEAPVDEAELSGSYWICSCCGCEYGYDDTPEYREEWLAKGAPWFSATKPPSWQPEEQLKRAIPDWVNYHYRDRG